MTARELFALRIALARTVHVDAVMLALRALEPVLGGTNPNAVPRYFH